MRFNSMIVRLKATSVTLSQLLARFQFYDSPIKRKTIYVIEREKFAFQFYDSPIKRRFCQRQGREIREFQFYDSPIKSHIYTFGDGIPSDSFNSMIVRLKDRTPRRAVHDE